MAAQITTEEVKKLRDRTGISVMQCRKALEEARGNPEKALAILKKASTDIALKKGSRETKDGAVTIKTDGKKGVLVSLHCETDFVARSEEFRNLLSKLADLALEKMSAQGAAPAKSGGQGPASGWKKEAKAMINPVIQKTGENIQLGEPYEAEGEVLGSYVHNGKIGVMVSLKGGNSELAKDIAMHTAAMKPEYTSESDVSEETKKTVAEIFQKEIAGVNKPEEIKKKMLQGKIKTYFRERTLLDQPFVKNPEITVGDLLQKAGAKIKEVKRYSI